MANPRASRKRIRKSRRNDPPRLCARSRRISGLPDHRAIAGQAIRSRLVPHRHRGAGHPLWAQVPPSVSSGACFGARRAVNTRLPATRRTYGADGATFARERTTCPTLASRSASGQSRGWGRTGACGSRRTSRVARQAKSCFDERRRAGHPQVGVCDPRAPGRPHPLRCPLTEGDAMAAPETGADGLSRNGSQKRSPERMACPALAP